MTDLDRLYSEITAACGVTRIRDIRLELLAMDRALEARYAVGTDGSLGIPHPTAQLLARSVTFRAQPTHSVHENAVWSYDNDWQADFVPQVVTAWMNSSAHRANLVRTADTHWGIGYHTEPPTGTQRNERIYVIAVFTTPLVGPRTRTVRFTAGTHTGSQFSTAGQVLGMKTAALKSGSALADARLDFPAGIHLHIANGVFAGFWVPELPTSQLARL